MGKSGIVLMKRTSIMTKVDEIQIRVQKYLSKELGNISVDEDGIIEFPFSSTKVTIGVKELMGEVVVEVFSPVIFEPKNISGLYEKLNVLNMVSPVSWVYIELDNSSLVIAKYTVLGEFLDFEELRYAISIVCNSADSLDEDMAKEFKAKRFIDIAK
jgi:hypothetical protein